MRLAPSILSADFARLGEEVARVEAAGAHLFHLDVMDGRYVPNLTFGPLVVEAIRRSTRLPLDVHLMMEQADRWLDAFIDAGADGIAVHPEVVYHLNRALSHVRSRGKRAGIAVNPTTPLTSIEDVLPEVDFVVVMSVNPGFGGQKFIPGSFARVERLAAMIRERGLSVDVAIDGGIDTGNVRAAVEAGANVIVAGSAVFKSLDPAAKVRELLAAARA